MSTKTKTTNGGSVGAECTKRGVERKTRNEKVAKTGSLLSKKTAMGFEFETRRRTLPHVLSHFCFFSQSERKLVAFEKKKKVPTITKKMRRLRRKLKPTQRRISGEK